MTTPSKNHTMSKFFAKLLVRLFILLLLFSFAPFLVESNAAAKLGDVYLYIENKWALVFPAMLFFGFITLLVLTLRAKYTDTDFNWMLSLNAVILIIYLIMLYIRVFPMIF